MAAEPLAPHGTLPGYYRAPNERQPFVDDLFDRSARHYDWICNVMSFGSGVWYRRQALLRAGLKPTMRVLDIGTGTGLVTDAMLRAGVAPDRVLGVDPSDGMLRHHRARNRVRLLRGVGDAVPVRDGTFDFVVMGYALRHVADLQATFTEYLRVLRPGGSLLLLEITRPRTRIGRFFAHTWFGRFLPLVTRIGTGSAEARKLMDYYWATIDACVPPERILAALTAAGFVGVERGTQFAIFSEYRARRPEAT